MILDAGFLIAVDRGEPLAIASIAAWEQRATTLATTEPVVAQVWRGGSQARLARLLNAAVVHPFRNGRRVGALLARSGTSDVVDAHLVDLAARLGFPVVTGDVDDLTRLADAIAATRISILPWPPPS